MFYKANKVIQERLESMDLEELRREERACRFGVRRGIGKGLDIWDMDIPHSLRKHRERMLPIYAERYVFIQSLIKMHELLEN